MNYLDALRINGKVFETVSGKWQAEVTNTPKQEHSDKILYEVRFRQDSQQRDLRLFISDAGIHHDARRYYERRIFDSVKQWLDLESGDGELEVF